LSVCRQRGGPSWRVLALTAGIVLAQLFYASARAEPLNGTKEADTGEANCEVLAAVAAQNDLPFGFFWRLIWQESRFDPSAVSPKGAQGIAQFMPRTARWRGLADPFVAKEALYESARWLRELLDEFGNLGLAAAAYNAGPGRVHDWLAHRAGLPRETRAYVQIITGRTAEAWAAAGVQQPSEDEKRAIPCTQVVELMRPVGQPRRDHAAEEKPPEWAPWGLQLAGARSEGTLRGVYAALQHKFPSVLGDRRPLLVKTRTAGMGTAPWYRLRLAEETRESANRLCSKLKALGGTCVVLKN
jgi:hypothetical protein